MAFIKTIEDQVARCNKEELNRVIEAVKLRQTMLARTVARTLVVGDPVQFTGRRGNVVQGTVSKVNTKTVVVDTVNQGRWKVTASMLTNLAA